MTARNQRTLKLIWEMVKSLTAYTPGILGWILKNSYFDNDSSYSELEHTIRRVTLEMVFSWINGLFADNQLCVQR